MDHLKLQMLQTIEGIEKRPMMYCSSASYSSVTDFLFGYFLGAEQTTKMNLNGRFTDWISAKGTTKTALIWSGYILYVMADKDEELALEILFKELKEFLNDCAVNDHLENNT